MLALSSNLNQGYRKVPNAAATDGNISYTARGVLVSVLAHPEHWRVGYRGLVKAPNRPACEGKDATRAALKELREAGYYYVVTVRGSDGKFATLTWMADHRKTADEWAAHVAAKTPTAWYRIQFPDMVESHPHVTFTQVKPRVGKPDPGGPNSGSSTHIVSTEEVRTEKLSSALQDQREGAASPAKEMGSPSAGLKGSSTDSRHIDVGGLNSDPELNRLRDQLSRLSAAHAEKLASAVSLVVAEAPGVGRDVFRQWAQKHITSGDRLYGAALIALELATFGRVTGASLEVARQKETERKLPLLPRELVEPIGHPRDELLELERAINKAERAVSEREGQHEWVTRLAQSARQMKAAGGIDNWANGLDEATVTRHGGLARVLKSMLDRAHTARNTIKELCASGAMIDAATVAFAEQLPGDIEGLLRSDEITSVAAPTAADQDDQP